MAVKMGVGVVCYAHVHVHFVSLLLDLFQPKTTKHGHEVTAGHISVTT